MPTALVVEDDAATRSLLTTALSHAGIDVASATNGSEALEILEAAADDCRVVLLDLLMPQFDARHFLSGLSTRTRPRPVIILVTAALGFEAIPEGIDLVIKKPFDIVILTATVLRILQTSTIPTMPPNAIRREPDLT